LGQAKKNEVSPTPGYRFIDTMEALNEFAQIAAESEIIAVDLEADSMFHFKEKVCLVQMAADGTTVVIDPLALESLSLLNPIFADPSICKVFHGADYDVRSLYRDHDIDIQNLFDTQLASMFLGIKETSLEAIVASHFKVELNKKYQKKDWSRRPLSAEMVEYAALDVAYLIPLARSLRRDLERKGRLSWVVEECELLSRVRPPEENNAPLFLKFKGAGRLEPRQLAALEMLLQMRMAIARQKDRPLFKVISNTSLKKIAVAMPRDEKQLKQSGALSSKQQEMYAGAIVEVLKNVRKIPHDQLPVYPRRRSPRLSRHVPERVKRLRAWRDEKASHLELDPGLVLNRSSISAIAVENPSDRAALMAIDGVAHWQVEAFGDEILKSLGKHG
jgi:ribonuclease D